MAIQSYMQCTIVKGLFHRVGLYITKTPPDRLDMHLGMLLSNLQINCVIDVGGHYGEYGMFLRKSGYSGHIVSFEPTAEAFEKLEQRAAHDDKWRVFKCALGASVGVLEINIARNSVFNSFLEATEFSHDRFQKETDIVFSELIEMSTLNLFYDRCTENIKSPHVFLKLDTQGFDIEVLKGAAQVLDKVLGLQSEVSMIPIYLGMPSMTEAVRYYQKLGFSVTGLYPITRDFDFSVIEFDCILRRKNSMDMTTECEN